MYYNNYMPNRWQNPMQQQQIMQQQFPQMPQQPLGLKGSLVSSIEEVRAMPVDMDGSETYFPHPASNSIFTKAIDMNGNQVIRRYVLEQDSNGNQDVTQVMQSTIDDMEKRIKNLEEILDGITSAETGGAKKK
jgi:hypothetical protein